MINFFLVTIYLGGILGTCKAGSAIRKKEPALNGFWTLVFAIVWPLLATAVFIDEFLDDSDEVDE